MRYCLFHYTWSNAKLDQTGDGNLFVDFNKFPSNKRLRVAAKTVIPKGSTVVITGWSEFSDVDDYRNFIGNV